MLAGDFLGPGGGRSGLGILDLQTGELREWAVDGFSPRWLPDGRRLLFASADGVHVLDTVTGEHRHVYTLPSGSIDPTSTMLTRDGRTFYFTRIDLESDIWTLDLGVRS